MFFPIIHFVCKRAANRHTDRATKDNVVVFPTDLRRSRLHPPHLTNTWLANLCLGNPVTTLHPVATSARHMLTVVGRALPLHREVANIGEDALVAREKMSLAHQAVRARRRCQWLCLRALLTFVALDFEATSTCAAGFSLDYALGALLNFRAHVFASPQFVNTSQASQLTSTTMRN